MSIFVRSALSLGELIKDASLRTRATQILGQSAKDIREHLRDNLAERMQRASLKAAEARRVRLNDEEDLNTVDLQVNLVCYDDSPAFMRTALWESLLDRVERDQPTQASAQGDDIDVLDDLEAVLCGSGSEYTELIHSFEAAYANKRKPGGGGVGGEDIRSAIQRDLARTFPTHPRYQTEEGRLALMRVLQAYSIHDTSVGYCQGMAFVAGLLLMYLPEKKAFAALVTLQSQASLRLNYLPGMEGLKVKLMQLKRLLRRRCAALAAHLETHEVAPVLFASSWFLSCFAADFSIRFSGRVMDILLAQRSATVVLRVALAILLEAASELLRGCHDFESIVVYLKSEPRGWSKERLGAVVTSALSMHVTETELLELADEHNVGASSAVVGVTLSTAAAEGVALPCARAPPFDDPLLVFHPPPTSTSTSTSTSISSASHDDVLSMVMGLDLRVDSQASNSNSNSNSTLPLSIPISRSSVAVNRLLDTSMESRALMSSSAPVAAGVGSTHGNRFPNLIRFDSHVGVGGGLPMGGGRSLGAPSVLSSVEGVVDLLS